MLSNVIPLPVRPSEPADAAHETTATVLDVRRAVYTVAEVSQMLSLSRGSTYAMVRSGEIPALKLGSRWVIPKRRFHAWLDNLPEATDAEINRALDALDRTTNKGR
ncbi:MAG TPA: helix-turn-helix domain-containing protein [Kineosporiaceae bacterium]|nr:helix-turn-helix domain-containing protein [Kineosporiaceae bacterium]